MKKIIFAFLVVAVLFPSPLLAREKVLDIKEVTSPGGIKAWLVEDHSVPVIALRFSFKGAGAALDPADKQGLAQLASNTMDEGAGDLDSITFQKELQDLSISLRFSSGRDDFGGSLKTLTRNKARALELLKLSLTQPRFDDEPVERMRAANKSRIRSSLSNPGWIAARLLNDRAFEGHPYAQNSGGTLSTLDNITPDDLRDFVRSRIGKNILHVSAAGDVTGEELAVLLDEIFGALPDVALADVPDTDVQNQGDIYVFNSNIPQTIIEVLQPGISRLDPDYHTAQIMNFILGGSGFGSRLMEEVREKRGLAYGIYTGFYLTDHLNGYTVSTSTANESAAEVLKLIEDEWQKMASAPVSGKELTDAKSYLIGSLPLSLTSTDAIAGLLLSLQVDGLPIDYLEQREKAIEAATAEDVLRVAQRILNPEQFVTIMVGQPLDIEAAVIEAIPNAE